MCLGWTFFFLSLSTMARHGILILVPMFFSVRSSWYMDNLGTSGACIYMRSGTGFPHFLGPLAPEFLCVDRVSLWKLGIVCMYVKKAGIFGVGQICFLVSIL